MASLKVVVICSVLLTALLAPALARIYIVDDGQPDGAVASGSDSKGGGGGSSSGLQLIRKARDAAAGWQDQEPSGAAAATVAASAPTTRLRSRGRKKYKDTLAEADVRQQEAFEALRTVEKRTRQGVDPSAGGAQASRPERFRRRKPQEPPPSHHQLEDRPSATGRNDEAISQQRPNGDAYSATGPSATGPSSEGADYDYGGVNQEAPELLRVTPQHQPPTAPSYPSSGYSSETNQLADPNSVQHQNLALTVTSSSPYNGNVAYSTIVKDSVSDYSESNRNSLHFTPSDSRSNPYVKTADPIQYTQVPESTVSISSQAHTLHSTDGGSDRLENQISSSYHTIHPVSDNPSLNNRPMKADDVLAYVHKKYEDQLPATTQQQAYSFQEFSSGQTVGRPSGQSAPNDLQPSTSNAVYSNGAGTGQVLRTVQEYIEESNAHISQQLRTPGDNNVASFQSSSNLNSRPHFDDGRPSEDSHKLVHTGPVFKFTLDDRMTPPTGYDSRKHSKETNNLESGVNSGGGVANRKGKSRNFGELSFWKQGGTGEKEENASLEAMKSQETGLAKVQFGNVGSAVSVSTGMNVSQSSDQQRGFQQNIAVGKAEALQGNLQESNIGGLVETSAPALGSKVQRDTEGFLGNQVSASRTVTGTLKFAPTAPDQTAMASTSGEEKDNFLSVPSDNHHTQKRTTAPALGNDPFTLTVGAKLQTGTEHEVRTMGENREARFSFPQSSTSHHQRMVFPDKVAHDGNSAGYTSSAALDAASASHQMQMHGQHGQNFRHHQPQNMHVQRLRPQRHPGSDIVYGSPPRPGAGRVQRPWGLVRPARGAPHPHPHRQRRPPRGSRPLRLHKVPSPPASGHSAAAVDSMPSSSSLGHPVALPSPSYGSGSSPPHVSFVEAGPWGQFRWSVSHDVALKPTLHWR